MTQHDKSIKIALGSKKLNAAIKTQCLMQSIDHLIDTIASKISEFKQKQEDYTSQK